MLPLYRAYGVGVLGRIAQFDTHSATNARLKEFIEQTDATLPEVRAAPCARVRVWLGGGA